MISGAQARVEAFIADFNGAWERAGASPPDFSHGQDPVAAWLGELARLVDAHCVAGMRTGEEGVLSSHPAHSPAIEAITQVIGDDDRARVQSVVERGSVPRYFEYRLVLRDGQWRIGQIVSFLDPPGAPLIDEAEAERLLAAPLADGPLEGIDAGLDLNIPSLFVAGREVAPFGTPATLSVVRLGDITCGSGVLTVRDFGYGSLDLEPLARRVPAGTYPVEVATVAGTNVALRLVLADLPAASWHPAKRAAGSHVVGVDAGNVAILDLASLVRCEAQQVEEVFLREADRLRAAPGTTFSLHGDVTDAAMVTSGYGDGAYPCYWGVSTDGTLVALVIDFLVLVEDKMLTVTAPWRPGPVDVPGLAEHDVEIVEQGHSVTVRYRGRHIRKIRVLGPDRSVLIDGDRLGLSVTGDLRTQTWQPETRPPARSVLELTVDRGYRHL